MKEPQEVLMDVQLDWKRKGISIETVREKLGYKTRQSVYNILSSDKYLKPELAKRFSEVFGYNMDYLSFGIGNLFDNHLGGVTSSSYLPNDIKSDLLFAAELLLYSLNDPLVSSVWKALTTGDELSYICNLKELIEKRDLPLLRVLLQDRYTKYVMIHTKNSTY